MGKRRIAALKAIQQNEFIQEEDHDLLLQIECIRNDKIIANYNKIHPAIHTSNAEKKVIQKANNTPITISIAPIKPQQPETHANISSSNTALLNHSFLKTNPTPETIRSTPETKLNITKTSCCIIL